MTCLPGQHAEPAGEDVGAGLDGGEAVQVVGQGEGQQRAQPQERHHAEPVLADGVVDGLEPGPHTGVGFSI